jgi:hypothetical protein
MLGRLAVARLGVPAVDGLGKSMNRKMIGSLVILVLSAVACGGGSADKAVPGPGGGSTTVAATFSADQPSPGPTTVAMQPATSSGAVFSVNVNVTDVDDVYGAAFDIVFDPDLVEFVNWSAGTLLEQSGQSPSYNVTATQPGRLVVSATLLGGVSSGVDAVGSVPIFRPTFRALDAGASSMSFEATGMYDPSDPSPMTGITWYGGTLTAN